MARVEKNENGEPLFGYSEIFHSFQGEGFYTGRSTSWIRFFACNLQCSGMGQKNPTDPSTYILPYKEIDLSNITRIEDLPVFEYGCDSGYTWSARYKHLMKRNTPSDICDLIQDTLKHESNPQGLFLNPTTLQYNHMAFTGGEPMLNQDAMAAIIEEFASRRNMPWDVTVETNGTRPVANTELQTIIEDWYAVEGEWFWSVSPKLWSTAGEKPSKAIKPEVVGEYAQMSNNGQLKYVVNGSAESWKEVEEYTKRFRDAGVNWDVYIMVAGATKEQQETDHVAAVAMEAMKRGYHFSGRLHCSVFGNTIGT